MGIIYDINPSLSWNISDPLPKIRGDADVVLSTKNSRLYHMKVIHYSWN